MEKFEEKEKNDSFYTFGAFMTHNMSIKVRKVRLSVRVSDIYESEKTLKINQSPFSS